jgi:hypothetical protein
MAPPPTSSSSSGKTTLPSNTESGNNAHATSGGAPRPKRVIPLPGQVPRYPYSFPTFVGSVPVPVPAGNPVLPIPIPMPVPLPLPAAVAFHPFFGSPGRPPSLTGLEGSPPFGKPFIYHKRAQNTKKEEPERKPIVPGAVPVPVPVPKDPELEDGEIDELEEDGNEKKKAEEPVGQTTQEEPQPVGSSVGDVSKVAEVAEVAEVEPSKPQRKTEKETSTKMNDDDDDNTHQRSRILLSRSPVSLPVLPRGGDVLEDPIDESVESQRDLNSEKPKVEEKEEKEVLELAKEQNEVETIRVHSISELPRQTPKIKQLHQPVETLITPPAAETKTTLQTIPSTPPSPTTNPLAPEIDDYDRILRSETKLEDPSQNALELLLAPLAWAESMRIARTQSNQASEVQQSPVLAGKNPQRSYSLGWGSISAAEPLAQSKPTYYNPMKLSNLIHQEEVVGSNPNAPFVAAQFSGAAVHTANMEKTRGKCDISFLADLAETQSKVLNVQPRVTPPSTQSGDAMEVAQPKATQPAVEKEEEGASKEDVNGEKT